MMKDLEYWVIGAAVVASIAFGFAFQSIWVALGVAATSLFLLVAFDK